MEILTKISVSFYIRLNQDGFIVFVLNQVTGVGKMHAIPGTRLDAPIIKHGCLLSRFNISSIIPSSPN